MASRPSVRSYTAWVAVILISIFTASCGGNGSSQETPPTQDQPVFQLAANPSALNLGPGSSLIVSITVSANNTGATPVVSLGTFPAGFTTSTAFPLTIGPNGATFVLQTAT